MDLIVQRYDQTVMNNVIRAAYAECMVAVALGSGWQLTWQQGWEWAPWDCEHKTTGARIEIKQSATKQPWSRDTDHARGVPTFDIAPRTGYWPREGSEWIELNSRPADLYVLALHDLRTDADQRDPFQWVFYVVAELDLPPGQKSISLNRLKALAEACGVSELLRVVNQRLQTLGTLKTDMQPQP